MLDSGGLGDALLAAIPIIAFKKKTNKKVLVITNSKPKYELLSLFKDIDELYLLKEKVNVLYKDLKDLRLEEIFPLYIPNPKQQNYYGVYSMAGSIGINLGDFYTTANDEFVDLDIDVKDTKSAKQVFKDLGLKENKTIFMSPYAVTFDSNLVSADFWSNLADKFIQAGYDVVFNSDTEEYKQYKNVFLPIVQVFPFVDLCAGVVAFRSGLIDLLAYAIKKPLKVIYLPVFQSKKVRANTEDGLLTLETRFGNHFVEELVFDKEDNIFIKDLEEGLDNDIINL